MGKSSNYPITDQYFNQLCKKVVELKSCKAQVEGRKVPDMNGWLAKVRDIEVEVEELRKLIGDKKSLCANDKLCKKVERKINHVECLKADFNGYSKLVNPSLEKFAKSYSYGDVAKFISKFSNSILSGDDGDIYTGKFEGKQIAVKVLPKDKVVDEIFTTEVKTIARASHRHVVKLYGFCFEKDMRALVYDYMENGSFDKVLYENNLNLAWEKLYSIAIGTARGIAYLHGGCRKQIIHHDIRAHNVLLDKYLSPHVTGFGLAKLLARDVNDRIRSRTRGTPQYAAPEMLQPAARITGKCDVYSFGIMLFEILGKKENRIGKTCFSNQVWEKFKDGQLDQIIRDCGIVEEDHRKATVLTTLALWCVQMTPEIRPSMSDVVMVLQKQMLVTSPPDPFLHYQPLQYTMSLQPSPSIPKVSTPTLDERNNNIDNDQEKEDNESQLSRKRKMVDQDVRQSPRLKERRLSETSNKQDEVDQLEKMDEKGKSSPPGKIQSPEKPLTPKQLVRNNSTRKNKK